MFKIRTFVTLGAGAAIAYFLDPQHGARRRQQALRRIQGDLAPQARGVAQKVAESAPQIKSLPGAGDAMRRTRRHAPAEAMAGEPAPGAPPPITES